MQLVSAALLAALAGNASAQDPPVPIGQEKFTLRLGAFLPAFQTKVQVDNSALGAGDRVDLEDDLGVDQDTSGGWFSAEWRFAPRHRIGFNYSRFTLKGAQTLQREIQIDDEIYPVGASTSTQWRLQIVPIAYSYSVMQREQDELALTAGLHWSSLSLRIQGSASLGAQDVSHEATAKADVPLPLFGLRYDRRLSANWSAGAGASVFALEFGEDAFKFNGSLWSARAYLEYHLSRHFGVGAAIDGFRVDVDAQQNDWQGGFNYGYWGPQLYLTARF